MKFLLAFFVSISSLAATETHTFNVPEMFTDYATVASVPFFNPTNGTLVSATLTVQVTNRTGTKIENLDRVPRTTQSGSTVTVTAGTLASAVASKSFTNALAAYDLVLDYAGPSGASNALATASASTTVVLNAASVTGTGSYDVPVTAAATSYFTGTAAYSFSVETKAAAKLTVVYTFLPKCEDDDDRDCDRDQDRDCDGRDRDDRDRDHDCKRPPVPKDCRRKP